MKIKPLYIYLIAIVIIILIIIFFDTGTSTITKQKINPDNSLQSQKMPADEVHKGLGLPDGSTPSESNVRKSVLDKMKKMEEDVKNNPSDTLKMKEYARFMSAAHQPEKAIEYYQKILKINPNRIDILLDLTSLYFNLKKISEAEKVTNRILKIRPDNSSAIYNLGVLKAVEGKKDEARKIWQDLVLRFPNSNAAKMAENSLKKL